MNPAKWANLQSELLKRKQPFLLQVLFHSGCQAIESNISEIRKLQIRGFVWFFKIIFNLKNKLSHLLFLCCFVLRSCHSLQPVEHEFYEGNEYLSSLPADADRAEDFEYEVRSMAHCNLSFCYYRYGICTGDSKLLWGKIENN